jgi:hypothetical protein
MSIPAIVISFESLKASTGLQTPSSVNMNNTPEAPRVEHTNDNCAGQEMDRASSSSSTPPTSFVDMNRWQANMGLETFGSSLHAAAQALFPHQNRARYTKVYVLLARWETEPELSVSKDISRLFTVFRDLYLFDTEIWKISDEGSQAEADKRVEDFIQLGDNSEDHLKIVCYAGNCLTTETRGLAWTRYVPETSLNHLCKYR